MIAACGGGGGGGGNDDDIDFDDLTYEERVETVALFGQRIGGYFNTGFTGQPGEMPTTGTARFSGYAVAVFDDALTAEAIEDLDAGSDPRLLLVGKATLNADFAAGSIRGEATDFFGKDSGDFGDYDGKVVFRDGEIGRSGSVPGSEWNDIRFRYNGTLTGQGNDVTLSGNADGKFKGTPIRGLIATDLDTNVLNGSDRPSFFGVVAEKD